MTSKTKVWLGVAAIAVVAGAIALLLGFQPGHILTAFGVGGAYMALTIPPTLPARNNSEQQLHFFRFRFQFGQISALSAGQKIGRLPARAFIHSVAFHKTTAFNSATTDTLQLGTTASGTDILAATTIQGTGYAALTSAAGLGIVVGTTGEVDLFAKYAQSGAAASAGDMTVVIAYIPDNDQ